MNNEIISRSPFGKEYRSLSDEPQEVSRLVDFVSDWEGKVVAIQGRGFVGSAILKFRPPQGGRPSFKFFS